MSGLDLLELGTFVIKKGSELGFDEVAVLIDRSRSCMIKFANNVVTVVQSWDNIKLDLYLAKSGRIAVASISSPSLDKIEKMLNVYRHRIELMEPSELYAELPTPNGTPLQPILDSVLISEENKVLESVKDMIEHAREVGAQRIAGMLEFGYNERILVTSTGAKLEEKGTYVKTYARAFVGDVSGQWAWTSTRFDRDSIVDVGRRAARIAVEASKLPTIDVEPGRYDVVLSPLVFANLLNYVAFAASALYALLGLSMFVKYGPGTQVSSEILTLYDDPHDDKLPGSTGFDDEGLRTFKKPLIERGVFKTFLHNTKTARKMNCVSTANAGWIAPHPWNLVVESGTVSEDSILRELGKGLYITNNWYTRYQNWIEGQFSTVARDAVFFVENGEPRAVTKRIRIADYMPNILRNIVALTKERFDIAWWEVDIPTRAPYALIRNVMITKPTI